MTTKKANLGLVTACTAVAVAFGLGRPIRRSAPAASSEPAIENFALLDQNGHLMELYRQSLAKAVVLISFGRGCPIVQKNLPALESARAKYSPLGVRFFLIDAFPGDDRSHLEDTAARLALRIPILMDDSQEISHTLDIKRTGEAIVVDPATWKIVFRGPIDDRFSYAAEKPKAGKNFLASALDAFLEHRSLESKSVPVAGCAISYDWPEKVTYSHDIAPIIQKHCYTCHRAHRTEPTELLSYQALKNWSAMLREVVRTEQMPPWEVDSRYGHYVGLVERLSGGEKKLIYAWLNSGRAEGSPSLKISGEKYIEPRFTSNWTYHLKDKIRIPAGSETPWHYELLAANVPEDRWISGLSVRLSDRSIVQHVALIIMKSPLNLSQNVFSPQRQQRDQVYGIIRVSPYKSGPSTLPSGLAYKIPKGSFLYLETHFSSSGTDEFENVEISLQKHRGPAPPNEVKLVEMSGRNFHIPPNQESYLVRAGYTVPDDSFLFEVAPHMHLRGKSIELAVIGTEGLRKILYSARYLFKSKRGARFKDPIFLPAGSKLEAIFEYDNSASNPAGIDNNKSVHYGPDAVANEMALLHVFLYRKPVHSPAPANARMSGRSRLGPPPFSS